MSTEIKKTIGKVIDIEKDKRIFNPLSPVVGSGSGEIKGEKKEFELMLGASSNNPIIKYKRRYFYMTWEEIADLAEAAGLFDDDKKEWSK